MIHFSRYLIAFSAITAVFLTSACGGGTIGTGINSMSERAHSAAPLTFTLEARVVNSSGSLQANAQVSIRSSQGTVSRVTSTAGVASLPLTVEPSEQLHIEVRSGRKLYQADDYISPAGASRLHRTLRLTADGGVELLDD
jgi:hypothetical protein